MTVQLQQVGVQYWFRVLLTVLFCISSVWFGIHQSYSWLGVSLCLLVLSVLWQIRLYRLHTKQVLFMIDALENNDNTFHFTEENGTPESKEINRALNRVGHILYSVKAETAQQEKYYELILDFVSTGLVVLNDNFRAECVYTYPPIESGGCAAYGENRELPPGGQTTSHISQ